jgi:hypothetical protein
MIHVKIHPIKTIIGKDGIFPFSSQSSMDSRPNSVITLYDGCVNFKNYDYINLGTTLQKNSIL